MMTGQKLAQKYIAKVRHVYHVAKRTSRLRPLNLVHQGTLNIPLPPTCCLGLYPTIPRKHPVGSTLCICNLLALTDGSRKKIFVLNDRRARKLPLFVSWNHTLSQNGIYLHIINNQICESRTDYGGLGMTAIAGMLDCKACDHAVCLYHVQDVQSFDYGGYHCHPRSCLRNHAVNLGVGLLEGD